MSTNPYESPATQIQGPTARAGGTSGRPCPSCGSIHTSRDAILHTRPSLLYVLLFGWTFLLIRGAFAMRSDRCRDYGAVNRYKAAGAWVALAVLVLIVLGVVRSFLTGELE